MTNLIDQPAKIAKSVFDLGKGELKESTLYAGILGLGAASLIGSAFIMLPFQKLPYGNYIRMASLVLGGAALVGWSRKQSADMKAAGTMAGTVMAAAGVLKGAADFGLGRLPGASTVTSAIEGGSTASFGSESEVMDDRNVIGQDGANFDTRPIAEPGDNVAAVGDEMDAGVAAMVGRFKPQERVPVDSVMESSTMAGTITQNFGADTMSTGWQNPHRSQKMSEFVDATDALAQGKMDNNSNPFVASIKPVTPSYQPQAWYAEEEMMIDASTPVQNAATMGGLPDTLGTYIVPGSSGNPFLTSVAMSSAGGSGRGVIENFGAEVFF
jgi:hypothetical protein